MRFYPALLVSLCQGAVPFSWFNPWSWILETESTGDSADDEIEWEITRDILFSDSVIPYTWSNLPNIENEIPIEQLPHDIFVGTLEGNIKTHSSSIFFGVLQESGTAVVAKYTNNCMSLIMNSQCRHRTCALRSEDELLDEYKMYIAVKELNILPRIYYLSPEVTIKAFNNAKVLTNCMMLGEADRDRRMIHRCSNRAKVRLMIQEKMGCDMHDFMSHILFTENWQVRRILLTSIVQVGLQLIKLLELLHNAGIIHGDIHEGNVAFERDIAAGIDWSSNRVVLLDMGLARFYPDDIGSNEEEQRQLHRPEEMMSPWNLANYRVGRRDDLYRAMELVCNLMTGRSLPAYFKQNPGIMVSASSFGRRLQTMHAGYEVNDEEYFLATNKMHANLFQADMRINKLSALSNFGLNKAQEMAIGIRLDQVVAQIRLIPSVDARPKYDEYIAAMNDVIQLIDSIDDA